MKDERSCLTCTSYVPRPALVAILGKPGARQLITDMGCEKNMNAVTWLGPCPSYEREPGADA